MEYDLWIQSGLTYAEQIKWDLNYYLDTWNVSPSKMILGLMPGVDDLGHNLTLQDAIALTTSAKEVEIQGIMTWDADIDSVGVDGNSPYAYSLGIENELIGGTNIRKKKGPPTNIDKFHLNQLKRIKKN